MLSALSSSKASSLRQCARGDHASRIQPFVAVALLVVFVLSPVRTIAAENPIPKQWTLAVLGDQQFAVTQKTGHDYLNRFSSQIDWLVANAGAVNLRMVAQVGDIVERAGIESEWERASAVMMRLDTATNADGTLGIPWCVAYGNHEIIGAVLRPTIDLAGPAPSANYRRFFGSARGTHRYARQAQFRGVSANDLNTWHIIRSSLALGARSYLILNLEIDIPGRKEGTNFNALDWAQQIIDQHQDLPTIIVTHVFEGSRAGPPNTAYLRGFGHNSQLEIFDALVKVNPQIIMVLSGHTSEDTHKVKLNGAGEPVLQMVTDYSKWVGTAGDGFFRLMEFDEAAGKVRVTTYSAFLDQHRTDANSRFEFIVDFDRRFRTATTKRD